MKENEIYIFLSNIDKLDKEIYDSLVSLYGMDNVHNVIEYMIDENEYNILKFEYYIEIITANFSIDNSFKNILEIYMKDMGQTRCFTDLENEYYSKETYNIIEELKNIFKDCKSNYNNSSGLIYNSILDEIQFYLTQIEDESISNRIKELQDRYILVRNKLVVGNLRAVVAALKSFYDKPSTFIEIIQYGNIGLMKAVEKYNPNMGTKFISYAYLWIRQSIRHSNKFFTSSISNVSYFVMERNNIRRRTINLLANELGREPTNEEIAQSMGISTLELEKIEKTFEENISLTAPIHNGSDGVNSDLTLVDIISDDSVNVEEEVTFKVLCDDIWKILEEILTEKQLFVMRYRYGYFKNDCLSMQQVARMMNVSRQRVQQYEKASIEKVRRYIKQNNC